MHIHCVTQPAAAVDRGLLVCVCVLEHVGQLVRSYPAILTKYDYANLTVYSDIFMDAARTFTHSLEFHLTHSLWVCVRVSLELSYRYDE